MKRALPLTAALLLTGCEDTLSADPFVTDAEFLAALPRAEDHTLAVASSTDSTRDATPPPNEDDGWPDLLGMSLEVATNLNSLSLTCLTLVDAVVEFPPTYRSPDGRQWGPVDVDNDVTIALDMVRTPDAYEWDFQAAATGSPELPSLCAGAHDPGTEDLSRGTGTLDIWLENWDDMSTRGTLATEYDLTVGQELRIDIEDVGDVGGRTESGAYYFLNTRAAGGDFQYRTTLLMDDGVDAILEVRTRWTARGEGRSDARVISDDYPRDYRFSECFVSGGRKVWRWTDLAAGYEEGFEGRCAFDEPAAVDEI